MSYPPPLLPTPPPAAYNSRDGYDRQDNRRSRPADHSGYGPVRRYRQDDRYDEEYKSDRDRQRRQSRSRSPPRDRFDHRHSSSRQQHYNQRYPQPPPPHQCPPPQPPPNNARLPYPHPDPYPQPPPSQPPPAAVSRPQHSSASTSGVLRIGFPGRQSSLPTSQQQPANAPPPTLSLPLPPPPPPPPSSASYRNPPITDTLHNPPRCAYVWLVMKGDAYVPGALVSAFSVSLTNTPHALVCMVTSDVSDTARSRLSLVFHRVIEVDYITAQAKPLRTAKQQALYSSWSDRSFTKWQCLSLVDYDRVLFVDADKLVLANVDHLFLLPAPAATFSSPWSTVYLTSAQKHKRGTGLDNPYHNLQHADTVPYEAIERGLHTNSFVCIGTMVLLQPSIDHHTQLLQLLAPYQQSTAREAPASFGYERCHSMLDEQSLTLLYHQRLSLPFTYIHQRYNYLCWHRAWLTADDLPYVFHYFSTKPWQMSRREWLDVEVWWRMAEVMVRRRVEGSEERAEVRRALGDGKQLKEERLTGCAWCKESKLEQWEAHCLFDNNGRVECPEMRKRQPRDGAERLQPLSAAVTEPASDKQLNLSAATQ